MWWSIVVEEFPWEGGGGGALRVKISRGAPLEVQNGTQQDLNKMIDLVNFGGKKIVYMLKMGGFEMGPNKIWNKSSQWLPNTPFASISECLVS